MRERRITDPDVQRLAQLAATLQEEYQGGALAWDGSPFAWIRQRQSRQRGKIGEQLVAGWFATKDIDVQKPRSTECDRLLEGVAAEIKFSTLWESGIYKFQQFRDQAYEIAVCLGISPFDAHCWVVPKDILLQHVIGHTPQHGGRTGRDTAWLSFQPERPPEWLIPYGGRLKHGFASFKRCVRAISRD